MKNLLQNFCSTPIEFLSIRPKLSKTYKRDGSLKLWVDPTTDIHKYLSAFSNRYIKTDKSRQAYIKMYYLYYFLIHSAKMKDEIKVSEIYHALGISGNTHRVLFRMMQADLGLTVNMDDHYDSVKRSQKCKAKGQDKESYERFKDYYLSLQTIKPSSGRKSIQISYSYTISEWLFKRLYSKGYHLFSDYYRNKPVNLLHNNHRLFSSILILSKNELNNFKHKDLTIKNENIFLPEYNRLDFANLTIGQAIDMGCFDKVTDFYRHLDTPVKFSSGRIFHAFHRLLRECRKYLRFEDFKLAEAMDVHNCFFVLLTPIFKGADWIDRGEIGKWEELVRSGRLYEDIAAKTGLPRDTVKEMLQRYRNSKKRGMEQLPFDDYFLANFPGIRSFIVNYTEYINAKDKKVKWMQIDVSHIETYIMSKICWALHEKGYHPFTLHDAIYLLETENESVKASGMNVEDLFWKFYDDLTTDDITEILAEARARKTAELNADSSKNHADKSKKSRKNLKKSVANCHVKN